MNTHTVKNVYNINSNYDIIYLILRNGEIMGIYDNSEVTFIKYINLISNELEILKKIKIKNTNICTDLLNELESYKIKPIIQNSDIILSTIKFSFISGKTSSLSGMDLLFQRTSFHLLATIQQSLAVLLCSLHTLSLAGFLPCLLFVSHHLLRLDKMGY